MSVRPFTKRGLWVLGGTGCVRTIYGAFLVHPKPDHEQLRGQTLASQWVHVIGMHGVLANTFCVLMSALCVGRGSTS
jgi:hypothetical protein